ncbi:hypothetical protein J2R76_003903 [Bradyrhizobium sp. USDA 4532]|nr:hypothetical protein [Bradyrhizobium sp. USDA 4545]MCP1920312.1 hypothetical protein [Bradyrhizobium sp. USDA 4532]
MNRLSQIVEIARKTPVLCTSDPWHAAKRLCLANSVMEHFGFGYGLP